MSVGTFVQPDFEAQSGTAYKTNIDNSIAALARIGTSFAPHEQAVPDMTVRLEAGALPYLVDGAVVEHAAQDTATITAPVTNPRIDLVVIDDETAAVSVITGVEAVSPAAPALTDGKLPICEIALATTTVAIDNTLITDKRIGGGSGKSEAYPINHVCQALTLDPAIDLGYGTWYRLEEVNGAWVSGTSHYPTQSGDYVKATNIYSTFYPYLATDPTKLLTGDWAGNQWLSDVATNQRFHIDLGASYAITGLRIDNSHASGVSTNTGAKNFTLWGSNSAAAFADLVYGHDTDWTQILTSLSQFPQHVASDTADPRYIGAANLVAYRYYAIKITDNWGSVSYLGLRRIELQISTLYVPRWLRAA